VARDIAVELMELYGLDVSTGEVRVRVDAGKMGQMRQALWRIDEARGSSETEGADDIDDSLDE
jgi:hypothetical protein